MAPEPNPPGPQPPTLAQPQSAKRPGRPRRVPFHPYLPPSPAGAAGAIYELYNHVLQHEYTQAQGLKARVVLTEMLPYLLVPYPAKLRDSALAQLQSLGVEVLLENPVKAVQVDHVLLGNGQRIPTATLVWTAGVRASPLAELLEVELTRSGRVPVTPTLQIIGLDHIYAIGDIVHLEDETGQPYPMLIPVATQQGKLVAANILRQVQGQAPLYYSNRGIMATIGRSRAVAWRIPLQGFLAWLAWLGLHLVTLMGFRNQVVVLINWLWNYLTYDRSVRLILDQNQSVKEE